MRKEMRAHLRWVSERAGDDGYATYRLRSDSGTIEARLYEAPNADRGVVWVGGVGGGFDTPANELYPRLAAELVEQGISSLRVRFRNPTDLHESVEDVLTGIEFLRSRGVRHVGLVGHSFGGAVVISAGAVSDVVETVVTLATQSHGTELVAQLAPASLLLIHGERDQVLQFSSSEHVYARANQPKEITIVRGASHNLDEASEQVASEVRTWLVEHLASKPEKAAS